MPFLDDSGVTKLASYLKTKIEAALEGKFSKVNVSRVLTEGTHAATITVDGTEYEVYAPTPPYAHTSNPLMNNNVASPGSSRYYSRGDHVHPTDTSRQAKLVSGTNIKTINGQSLVAAGNLSFSDLSQSLTGSEQIQAWENLGIQDLFGRNEPTSTALYSHTAGRTFVFGTKLVQCTADIAVGDTIAIGTNVTETAVNTVINKLITHDILPKVTDNQVIPDNADLDDYWMPGVWEIFSSDDAATMTNVPTTYGGAKLITIAATAEGAYSSQFYLTTYGEIWRRYKRNTTDTPSEWTRIVCQSGARTSVTKNSSFNASTFSVQVYPYPHFAIIYYNISLPSLTAATTYTMCTIPTSLFTAASKYNFTVSGQAGNGYLLSIETGGNFTIYSPTARTNNEFIRGTLTVPTTF